MAIVIPFHAAMRRSACPIACILLSIASGGCGDLDPSVPRPGTPCDDSTACGDFTCYDRWCHVDPASGWACRSPYDGVFPCMLSAPNLCRSGKWQCGEQQCLPGIASLFDGREDGPCRETEAGPTAPASTPSWFIPDYCTPEWWNRPDSPWQPSRAIRPVLLETDGTEARRHPSCPADGWCMLDAVDSPVTRSSTCAPSYSPGAYSGRIARWPFSVTQNGAYRLWLQNDDPPKPLPPDVRLGDAWLLVREGVADGHLLPLNACLLNSPPNCAWNPFGTVLTHCVGLETGAYNLYMFDHVADSPCPCNADDCHESWVVAPPIFFDVR